GLLKDGDMIVIDADKGTLEVELSDAELAARRKAWTPKPPAFRTGALAHYAGRGGGSALLCGHLGEDRLLVAEKQWRARQVDELAFVFEQRQSRGPRLGLVVRCDVVEGVPPQLGDAVEHLRRAAAGDNRRVNLIAAGVHLHIATNAEDVAETLHQRRMLFVPIGLKLL